MHQVTVVTPGGGGGEGGRGEGGGGEEVRSVISTTVLVPRLTPYLKSFGTRLATRE